MRFSAKSRYKTTNKLALKLIIIILIIFVGNYTLLYRPYVDPLEIYTKKWIDPIPPAGVTPKTMADIGRIQTDKKSSFINFKQTKPTDIIRIGCFGCSYTYGDEVGYSEDYPTQLQNILDKVAPHQYQVLNFGTSWNGFHQAYALFEDVGKNYNLDYVVFGPRPFYFERDNTFNNTWDYNPEYMHARFILNVSGNLIRLSPLGGTLTKRVQRYYQYIPCWQYLRYDKTAPVFIRSFNKNAKNPFYYFHGTDTQEMIPIYKQMLQTICQEKNLKKTIIVSYQHDLLATLAEALPKNKFIFSYLGYTDYTDTFPYRMPRKHASLYGNQLIAQQMASLILAKPISVYRKAHTINTSQVVAIQPLSQYKKVQLCLNKTNFGSIVEYTTQGPNYKSVTCFKKDTLLLFQSPNQGYLDSSFINTAQHLTPNTSIYIKNIRSGAKIKLSCKKINEFIWVIQNIPLQLDFWEGPAQLSQYTEKIKPTDIWEIYINNERVLSNQENQPWTFYKFVGMENFSQSYPQLPSSGDIMLMVDNQQIPLAKLAR